MTTTAKTTITKTNVKKTKRAFVTESSAGPVGMNKPQRMGTLMWRPMFAMALIGFVVAIILAGVRSSTIGEDAADTEALRHLVTGFMFLGFTGVFAAISFAIARILGVFRVGGGQVQDDVGKGVLTLKMPPSGRAFIALMMMGMMAVMAGAIAHIVVGLTVPSAAEADLLTSERWFLFGEGLRRIGVGLYLLGITMGLTTIIQVIRFQSVRIRQLV